MKVIKSLQRQHQITIKRLERIEKSVADGTYEPPPEQPETLANWFRGLLGINKTERGDRDGTRG